MPRFNSDIFDTENPGPPQSDPTRAGDDVMRALRAAIDDDGGPMRKGAVANASMVRAARSFLARRKPGKP